MVKATHGMRWTRKHDNPDAPAVAHAPTIDYPTTLEELIQICADRTPSGRLHAAGSHWALSEVAISDSVFIETHDPLDENPGLNQLVKEVVPDCLSDGFKKFLSNQNPNSSPRVDDFFMPVHVQAGMRVYEAYSALDKGDPSKPLVGLNSSNYAGSWAFRTLGGAGGQTVFGALTTGTHGGDIDGPPIADDVLALHLVVDGGKHYWLERRSLAPVEARLTDETRLKRVYGDQRYGGPKNFEVIYDDDLFYSVLISPGRFGIVYSVVLRTVRQYFLHEERRLVQWEDVRAQVLVPSSALYRRPSNLALSATANKFLQIVISVTPKSNFSRHQAAVTKRWNTAPVTDPRTGTASGRVQRAGAAAGKTAPYKPDPSKPGSTLPSNFLERACAGGDFIDALIAEAAQEIKDFVTSNGTAVGSGILLITVTGAGTALVALLPALAAILAILAAFLTYLKSRHDKRQGQSLNELAAVLLNGATPELRAAGIFAWQLIGNKVFASQQQNHDFDAISYAVMDGHDYTDKSCQLNAQSIEVFFDASNPMLTAYVDALLAFEIMQEVKRGKAFVGYISLRFMRNSQALLAPQQWPTTCAVEVAGLNDVSGVKGLIDYAIQLALNPNFKGILHWGQRNESTRAHIEERFGDSATNLGGKLGKWRQALARITQNGTLDRFSNEFTRRTGLEIVMPTAGVLTARGTGVGSMIDVRWDWSNNPVAGYILKTTRPNGSNVSAVVAATGSQQVRADVPGFWLFTITATIDVAGLQRQASSQASVTIV